MSELMAPNAPVGVADLVQLARVGEVARLLLLLLGIAVDLLRARLIVDASRLLVVSEYHAVLDAAQGVETVQAVQVDPADGLRRIRAGWAR